MGQSDLYDAFATIGSVASQGQMLWSCFMACLFVCYAFSRIDESKQLQESQKRTSYVLVFIAAVCLCIGGMYYAKAARSNRNVAALGGLWAFMR